MHVADTAEVITPEKAKSKRGGPRENSGRPRKDGLPIGSRPVGQVLPVLPGGRNAKLEQVAKWWHELNEKELNVLVVYFYRTWPAWVATKYDPKAQKNIKIIAGACPYSINNFEKDFMAEFGSGDYYLTINEGSTNRWIVHFKTTRDLDNYPPVLDYRLLDTSDPVNKTFIGWARSKGRLTDKDLDLPQSESDMANAEALNRVLDITERQSERIMDLSAQAAQRPEQPDSRMNAELKGMELIQEGAKETIGFMRETMQDMARSNTQNNNPLEVVEKVMGLATAMNGSNGKSDTIMEMMRADRDAANRREEMLRSELADTRKMMFELLSSRRREDEEERPRGLLGMLGELKQLKEVAADLGFKTNDSVSENPEGVAGGKTKFSDTLIEMALRNAPAIMAGADSIVRNLLTTVIALKQGQMPMGQQPQQQPMQPQQQPSMPPAAIPQTPASPLTPFLTAITPTLIHHFNYGQELGGATFAQWLIDAGPITTWPQAGMTGRGVYDFLKESGKEAITVVLKTHAPIWDTIGNTPAKLDAFIDEFLKADDPQQEGEE